MSLKEKEINGKIRNHHKALVTKHAMQAYIMPDYSLQCINRKIWD